MIIIINCIIICLFQTKIGNIPDYFAPERTVIVVLTLFVVGPTSVQCLVLILYLNEGHHQSFPVSGCPSSEKSSLSRAQVIRAHHRYPGMTRRVNS